MTLPPGPRMPAPAQVLAWGARPTGLLEDCLRRYGDAFTLRLLGFGERGFSDVVFLTHPDDVKTLFTAGPDKLIVGELRSPMAPMFGSASILLLDGRAHLRQRKLLLPPFHGERMAAYRELMVEATEREIDRWPSDRPFALQPPDRLPRLRYRLVGDRAAIDDDGIGKSGALRLAGDHFGFERVEAAAEGEDVDAHCSQATLANSAGSKRPSYSKSAVPVISTWSSCSRHSIASLPPGSAIST